VAIVVLDSAAACEFLSSLARHDSLELQMHALIAVSLLAVRLVHNPEQSWNFDFGKNGFMSISNT
jgi:hypothetical protein